jgi:hypothetical protein
MATSSSPLRSRISSESAYMAIAAAVSIDFLQLLSGLSFIGIFTAPLISFAAYIAYWFWFRFHDVGFATSVLRTSIAGISALLELAFFSFGLTGFVFLTVLIVWW